jgi:integrase
MRSASTPGPISGSQGSPARSTRRAELARLWADPQLALRPSYLNVCKLAVLTGMRQGELIALTWNDVDLLNQEIHVRQTYAHGIGIETTKVGRAAHGRPDVAGGCAAQGVVRGVRE